MILYICYVIKYYILINLNFNPRHSHLPYSKIHSSRMLSYYHIKKIQIPFIHLA